MNTDELTQNTDIESSGEPIQNVESKDSERSLQNTDPVPPDEWMQSMDLQESDERMQSMDLQESDERMSGMALPKSDELMQTIDQQESDAYETQLQKKWDSIGLENDFIFGKVMQDPELCIQLLRRIFPEMQIERIEYPQLQKTFKADMDSHGIRMDVYVRDEKSSIYDMEMQTVSTDELPKRSRYYQSMIDIYEFDAGKSYMDLVLSFEIFICLKDIFGEGRHKYTFERRCRENPNLILDDDTLCIFLNASGTMDDVSEELKAFLNYLTGKLSDDLYVKQLEEAVRKAKESREWRHEFMTLEMRDRMSFYRGEKKGKKEGRAVGRAEGRAQEIIEISMDYGEKDKDILEKLQRKLEISLDTARAYLEAYGKRVV